MKLLAPALLVALALNAGAARAELPAPPPTDPTSSAIPRGGDYLGFAERFNRAYTDLQWRPSRTLYVSPDGAGDGGTAESPMAAAEAIAAARPGTKIIFRRGRYAACFEFSAGNGGTYDDPVVLAGERNGDGSVGVTLECCGEGRGACFNLEAADYVAIDGFELAGGTYGVRSVGAGYAASEHQRGTAVTNCIGHDQEKDPFFSGQSDWAVWERNVAYGAKEGDGHGIYLSNGSDWNIVRFNETYANVSSDFQINADPASTCDEEGIAFDDPQCDAYAGTGEGGRGASDYFLVDSNYFHHGNGPGANFTGVRRSIVRNNVFGPSARHNVSFWQETGSPALGSRENVIANNLFLTTARHGVQFTNFSDGNVFENNILIGVTIAGGTAKANPSALLMEVDETVGANVYRRNIYIAGRLEGRTPSDRESALPDFSPAWFAAFPVARGDDVSGLALAPNAPFRQAGSASPYAPADRTGTARPPDADPGPFQSR